MFTKLAVPNCNIPGLSTDAQRGLDQNIIQEEHGKSGYPTGDPSAQNDTRLQWVTFEKQLGSQPNRKSRVGAGRLKCEWFEKTID